MVRLIRLGFCVILASTLTACMMGTDFSRAPTIRTPYGPFAKAVVEKVVEGRATDQSYVYEGEVFEVRPDGFVLVRAPGKLTFIAWNVAKFEIPALGIAAAYGAPAPKDYELMRLASRHPYGLAPEHLKVLLAGFGQTAIEEVRR